MMMKRRFHGQSEVGGKLISLWVKDEQMRKEWEKRNVVIDEIIVSLASFLLPKIIGQGVEALLLDPQFLSVFIYIIPTDCYVPHMCDHQILKWVATGHNPVRDKQRSHTHISGYYRDN